MPNHSDSSEERDRVQLSIKALKGFAKNLKRRSSGVSHSHLLERLCRSAGYTGYFEAHHRPRALSMSPEVWRMRLAEHLQGVVFDPPLSAEEFQTWYERMFRPVGLALDPGEGDDYVPAATDHLRTIADALAQPDRRTRRHARLR